MERDALERARRTLREGNLGTALADLTSVERALSRAAHEDVPLSRHAARAQENLDLAHALMGEGSDRARFHLERALHILEALDGEITRQTRDTDEAENRRHFMSG